jgi:hypothetical protein
MIVQRFTELSNPAVVLLQRLRKRKGVEARCFKVAKVVSNSKSPASRRTHGETNGELVVTIG